MFERRGQRKEDAARPKYISVCAYVNGGLFPPGGNGFRLVRTAQG